MRLLTPLFLALLVAAPALAGEPACGGCVDGFTCENQCPLAQQANAWRAVGREALCVRSRVQADAAAVVAKNLSKI